MQETTAPDLSRPASQVIRARVSWRSYTDEPLAPETRERLTTFLAETTHGPFGTPLRFQLIEGMEADAERMRSLGTYGFIKGGRTWLVGAVTRGPRDMEDYGYCFEQCLLLATDLGVRTCWLGGTLNRSAFGDAVACTPDEVVPAVSPVGLGTEKRSLRDRVIRLGAGSHKRKGWEKLFFRDDFGFPLTETEAGPYALPLEMLRLAPSAGNGQSWRVIKKTGSPVFHLFLQRTRFYELQGGAKREPDLQRIDMGIAMSHFQLATTEADLQGAFQESDPGLTDLPPRTSYCVSWLGS